MVLKFFNDFPKGVICDIRSTFGSHQNYYQGNVYVNFQIKTIFTIFALIAKVRLVYITKVMLSGSINLFFNISII